MRINLCNTGNFRQLDDVVLQCLYGLRHLGHQAELGSRLITDGTLNILFGAHCVSAESTLPPQTIIYNFEQTSSPFFHQDYIELLRQAVIWDYSEMNAQQLHDIWGLDAQAVTPGYVPEMSCLRRDLPKTIDVLFYGALNERRRIVLDMMKDEGIEVVCLNAYGAARDAAIARARMVLNIHYYCPACLEIARLGYLWANHVPVLCERHPQTSIPSHLRTACLYAKYDHLAAAAKALLARPEQLSAIGEAGFGSFSAKPFTKTLKEHIGQALYPVKPYHPPLPRRLNVGSGKKFDSNALNIDIEPRWNPDLVLDISRPLLRDTEWMSSRFGTVRFEQGMFDYIEARDVLEHIDDLPQAMTNILQLLSEGGEVHITVPYDLSWGAWQDPTHKRAFNEYSWLYYTDWHWYMGWKSHRFDLMALNFVLSEYGKVLQKEGLPQETILRSPRAVDSMSVVLRKRATNAEEQAAFEMRTHSCYKEDYSPWQAMPV